MVGASLKRIVLAALVAASFTTVASAQQTGGLPTLSDQVAVLQQIVSTQQSSLASLQTVVTTLQTALAAETQQRIAAQQTLQSALAAETQQRIAAQQALHAAIAQETTQRVAGDAALQSALNTEAGVRQSADQALANSINTENKIDVYFGTGSGGAIPDDDAFHELVSKTLPPGVYAVIASARIGQDFSNGNEIAATCELRSGAAVLDRVRAELYDAHFGDKFEHTMMATVFLPSEGSLNVLCSEAHDHPGVGGSARIMAIRLAD